MVLKEKPDRNCPIGVFDSGLGGLTVLKAIISRLPWENTIYLGDTARVPYGTRSKETIIRYSLQNTSFLISRCVKLLVVACNTSSAVSLPVLADHYHIPVVGVIEPGARAAARQTKTGRIGVIGTMGTINSGAYEKAIARLLPEAEVISLPCPLFVPLAEEGWVDNSVARSTAEIYLRPMIEVGIDTLLLGCTHYPLLKEVIGEVSGSDVTLIDSALETAAEVENLLKEKGLLAPSGREGERKFYVTDLSEHFQEVGQRFFGEKLVGADLVDLESAATGDLKEGEL